MTVRKIGENLTYMQGKGLEMTQLTLQIGKIAGRIKVLSQQPFELETLPALIESFGKSWQKAESIKQKLTTIRAHIKAIQPASSVSTMTLQAYFLSETKRLVRLMSPLIFTPLQEKAEEIRTYQKKEDLKKKVAVLSAGQKILFYRRMGQHFGKTDSGSVRLTRQYGEQHYTDDPDVALEILNNMKTKIKRYHTYVT
ncbi:MAG: hypothetical protein K2P51_07220 [Rhabdochlamydiaceae bacterium]|nr:hypothetical protein [Rhabdochlamydiaceae bacterium]